MRKTDDVLRALSRGTADAADELLGADARQAERELARIAGWLTGAPNDAPDMDYLRATIKRKPRAGGIGTTILWSASWLDKLIDIGQKHARRHPAPARRIGIHVPPIIAGAGGRRYVLGETLASGRISVMRRAWLPQGTEPMRRVVAKIARRTEYNARLANEARALRRLGRYGEEKHAAYQPDLLDSVMVIGADGIKRRVNFIGSRSNGWFSFAQLAAAMPNGVPILDLAWMWRRLLVALGNAHRAGVIHGAVLPEHVLIMPEEHGLTLVDWTNAVVMRDPNHSAIPASPARRHLRRRSVIDVVSAHRALYPPEALAGEPIGPETDIAMASRLIASLFEPGSLGAVRSFVAGCSQAHQASRPSDAWAVLADLDALLERLYGPRKFRPFVMPPIPDGTQIDSSINPPATPAP